MRLRTAVISAALGVGLAASSLSAATIGYWRFEDTGANWFNTAGSPTLTMQGTVVQQANAAPVNFPNPVPLTLDANNSVARFGGTGFEGALTTGTAAGDMIIVPTSFTAEAFFRWVSPGELSAQNRYILSHWQSTGTQRAWGLAYDIVNDKIRFILSSDGSALTVNTLTDLSVTPAGNYYVALVFDGTTSTNDVTVYLKDLDDPNATLQSQTFSSGITALHGAGSIAKPFSISSLMAGGGGIGNPFFGQIDEVRYSSVALSVDDLLIIPEPSALGLLGLGALGLIRRRRV